VMMLFVLHLASFVAVNNMLHLNHVMIVLYM